MWKVIYIAPTEERAARLKQLLADNGFLSRVSSEVSRPGRKTAGSYEISVPFMEAEDAYEVLCEHKFQG